MEINRNQIDPQTRANNLEHLRVNPDHSGTPARSQESQHNRVNTHAKENDQNRELLRHELDTTSKFDQVLHGKNQASQVREPADHQRISRAFEVRQDHVESQRTANPSSYEQVRSQNTQIADAQIVQNTQKVSGENQQIRWDNFATYGNQSNPSLRPNAQHDVAMNSFQAPIQQSKNASNLSAGYHRFAQSTFFLRA